MKVDWSAYKITLLLYIGVLLLPIGFYFSYTSFKELQLDTQTLNKLTLNSALVLNLNDTKDTKISNKIDLTFEEMKPWMMENNSKDFYVGSVGLLERYEAIIEYWEQSKLDSSKLSHDFFKETQLLVFSLKNMLELKQNKIYYFLYINLFVTMIFLLALIFFVRVYIHQQLSKHAIYDLKTNLYTKDYLLATLKEIIAKSIRSKETLSALYIDADELSSLDQSHKGKLLNYIGSSLLKTLRLSDIACRYGEHEFVVILPDTKEESFDVIINRLTHDLSKIKCEIKAVEYSPKESHDDFLERLI